MAREAAVYPFKFCKAILVGFRNQMVIDGRLPRGSHGIQALFGEDSATSVYVDALTGEALDPADAAAAAKVFTVRTDARPVYVDSITGQPLDGNLVRAARKEELTFFASKNVCRRAPRAEALQTQGTPLCSVKWVDVNKAMAMRPIIDPDS